MHILYNVNDPAHEYEHIQYAYIKNDTVRLGPLLEFIVIEQFFTSSAPEVFECELCVVSDLRVIKSSAPHTHSDIMHIYCSPSSDRSCVQTLQ